MFLQIVLEEDAWPNGIAIDPEQDRIYWTEGRRSLIKSAVLHDGSDVTVFSSSVNHPYSLSKLGEYLLMTFFFIYTIFYWVAIVFSHIHVLDVAVQDL